MNVPNCNISSQHSTMPESEKNALYRAVYIYEIRNRILDCLPNSNVLNFNSAFKLVPSSEDSIRYAKPSRHIIGNKQWLNNKIKEGYMFTVLSPNLHPIHTKLGHCSCIHNTSTECTCPKSVIKIILIVTRNGKYVPCTADFMPTNVLSSWDMDHEASEQEVEWRFRTRSVIVNAFGCRMEISLSLSEGPISLPMTAFGSWLETASDIFHYHLGKGDETIERTVVGGIMADTSMLAVARQLFAVKADNLVYRVYKRRTTLSELRREVVDKIDPDDETSEMDILMWGCSATAYAEDF